MGMAPPMGMAPGPPLHSGPILPSPMEQMYNRDTAPLPPYPNYPHGMPPGMPPGGMH